MRKVIAVFLVGFILLSLYTPFENVNAASDINSYFNSAKNTVETYFGGNPGWNPQLKIVPGDSVRTDGDTILVGADLFSKTYGGVTGGKGFYMVMYELVDLYLNHRIRSMPGNDNNSPVWHFNPNDYKEIYGTKALSEAITINILKSLLPKYGDMDLAKVASTRESEIATQYKEIGKKGLFEWTLELAADPTTVSELINRMGSISGDFSQVPDIYGAPYKSAILKAILEQVNPGLADTFPIQIPENAMEKAKIAVAQHNLQIVSVDTLNLYPIENLKITINGKDYQIGSGINVLSINTTTKEYLLGLTVNSPDDVIFSVKYMNSTTLKIIPVKYEPAAGAIVVAGEKRKIINSKDVGTPFYMPLAGYPWELGYIRMHWAGDPNGWLNYNIKVENGKYVLEGDCGRVTVSPFGNSMFTVTFEYNKGYTFIFKNAIFNVTQDMLGKTFIVDPASGIVLYYTQQVATTGTTSTGVNFKGWHLVGDAYIDSNLNAIVLTPDQGDKAGAAWYIVPIPLTKPFTFIAKFYSGNQCGGGGWWSSGGGDGIWVGFQSRGLDAIGGDGSGVGISGVTPALGFKLWEYESEVDFYDNGNWETISSGICFADDHQHTLEFSWDPSTQTMSITVDGTNTFTKQVDAIKILGNTAYFGFSGGTGGASNLHYVIPTGGKDYILSAINGTKQFLTKLQSEGVDVGDLIEELNQLQSTANQLTDNFTETTKIIEIAGKISDINHKALLRIINYIQGRYTALKKAKEKGFIPLTADVDFEAAQSSLLSGNLSSAIEYINQAYNYTLGVAKSKYTNIKKSISDLLKEAIKYHVPVVTFKNSIDQAETQAKNGEYIDAYLTLLNVKEALQAALNNAKTQAKESTTSSTTSSERTTTTSKSSTTTSSAERTTTTSSSEKTTTTLSSKKETQSETAYSETETTSSVTRSNSGTSSGHPLKVGDWFKYKISFKASSGDEKEEGTIYITYKIISVNDNGFTVNVTKISGDVDKWKEVFGELPKEVGDIGTIPWNEDPSNGNIYADPSKLPKDGKVSLTDSEWGIEGYAKYDTKKGILKEESGKVNILGISVSLTEKLEDSNAVKSGGGICGPAAIVGLIILPLLWRKKRE